MGFKDLTEVIDVREPKILPIFGEMIEFPDVVSAQTGQVLLAMITAGQNLADDGSDEQPSDDEVAAGIVAEMDLTDQRWQDMTDEVLGPAAHRLTELGIAMYDRRRMHIVATLAVWHIMGREPAELYWDSAGKARAPKAAPSTSD